MYNVKIFITNTNSVKNTTADFFSAARNFAILYATLLDFAILFTILENVCNTFCNTWKKLKCFEILQYLSQYFVILQYQSIAILYNNIAIKYYWTPPWL